jgi:hypothetical protein
VGECNKPLVGGVPFDDVRVTYDEVAAMRAAAGRVVIENEHTTDVDSPPPPPPPRVCISIHPEGMKSGSDIGSNACTQSDAGVAGVTGMSECFRAAASHARVGPLRLSRVVLAWRVRCRVPPWPPRCSPRRAQRSRCVLSMTLPRGGARTPFGQVPVLEIDGVAFSQSGALLRYAGRDLHSSTFRLNVSTFCGIRSVHDFPRVFQP